MRASKRSRSILCATAVLTTALLAACGSSTSHGGSSMPGMDMTEPMPSGNGLSATDKGFTFAPISTTLKEAASAGFTFRILGADGKPVTAFQDDQTKQMHFYLIRTDLSGFQHVHPVRAADGTWTAPLASASAGSYRAYASFITAGADGKAVALTLSTPVTAPGAATTVALPPASATTTVDGYTLTVSGSPMTGMEMPLKVTVAKDGKPVTDLQPYLATYAHLSAFHAGDLAFAHLHPQGAAATDTGGPDLTFDATFPGSGDWRVFLQFQTGGNLHTAAITVKIG